MSLSSPSDPAERARFFERQRARMVEEQLVARGIKSPRVLHAMASVPRHRFVHPKLEAQAYEDKPHTIGGGQTISQPYMVALMTELLDLGGTEKVLEVGTGSGYQTALLCQLAAQVVTVERHPELAKHARRVLENLGITRVTFHVGDGTLGCEDEAPFDAILVTAGGPRVPPSLRKQLGRHGRLVCPVGTRKVQRIVRYRRVGNDLIEEAGVGCVFVPLIGEEGWHESPADPASRR